MPYRHNYNVRKIITGSQMFIQNLDKKQQSVLLHLAKEVVEVDGELHKHECQILSILTSQVDDSVLPRAVELNDMAALFDTNNSRISLLLELIGVAHADGYYHHEENALIQKYAEAMNISEDKLLKLKNWVSKQISLSVEVQELLA